jgi:lipopolysaccharide/colanic/teichoic acid biosynthesis glycosyltransferase
MKPGLTGIASLVFRDEEGILDRVGGNRKYIHDEVIAPFKGDLELWWTKHNTIGNYFKIIFLTAWSLVSPRTKLWKSWFKGLPEVPAALLKMGV